MFTCWVFFKRHTLNKQFNQWFTAHTCDVNAMENFFQRKSIDGTYTTVPIDQPFMSKLIIYVEEPTVSSNSFNWYAVAMYGMTSRNLFHFKQKKELWANRWVWKEIRDCRTSTNYTTLLFEEIKLNCIEATIADFLHDSNGQNNQHNKHNQ